MLSEGRMRRASLRDRAFDPWPRAAQPWTTQDADAMRSGKTSAYLLKGITKYNTDDMKYESEKTSMTLPNFAKAESRKRLTKDIVRYSFQKRCRVRLYNHFWISFIPFY